jgi:hypothetical protein
MPSDDHFHDLGAGHWRRLATPMVAPMVIEESVLLLTRQVAEAFPQLILGVGASFDVVPFRKPAVMPIHDKYDHVFPFG